MNTKSILAVLNSFKTNTEMLRWCNKNLTKLGRGSSRTVYLLETGKVLKVAHNMIGHQQNQAEVTGWNYLDYDRPHNKKFFAKIYTNLCHYKDFFIVQEYCNRLSTKEVKPYVDQPFSTKPNKNQRVNRFMSAVLDMDNNLAFANAGDLQKSNLGRSMRGAIKLMDYGLSRCVCREYHKAAVACAYNIIKRQRTISVDSNFQY